MQSWKTEAAIIAAGLLLSGVMVRQGIRAWMDSNRTVSVKGLAEMEVPANQVTWPLVYKILGSDLNSLYNDIHRMNTTIAQFLKEKGIEDSEISIGAPEIYDQLADRYSSERPSQYRYNVTTVITVTSKKVDLVRSLISEQGELLKRGIAITTSDYRYNVVYEYTDLNSIKPQMIEEATKNARKAGEKFAKDSDSELGKIQNANQGQFSITDRDANTPYIKKVRVVTTIDYSLED